MKPSQFIVPMRDGTATYTSVWQDKDESGNFAQRHDSEMIKEMLRPEVRETVRVRDVGPFDSR